MTVGGKSLSGGVYGAQFGVTQRRVWSLGLAFQHSSFSSNHHQTLATPAFTQEVNSAKVVLQLFPFYSDFSFELAAGIPLSRRLETRDPAGNPTSVGLSGNAWEASVDFGYSWFFRRAPFFIRPSLEFARGRLGDDSGVPGSGAVYNQETALFRVGYVFN